MKKWCLTLITAGSCCAAAWAIPGDVVIGATQGPDVIVGACHDVTRWGQVGSIHAYSVGTTSCSIGTTPVLWRSSGSGSNEHPVIAQNFYRLKDGRFEQIGQSWLKHGFTAVNNGICGTCDGQLGTRLGVGCSDPYGAGLNGSQGSLGARFEVNAYTGVFPVSPTRPGTGTLNGRLQVEDVDVDPGQNAGAIYWAECQYVTADDAQAGNGYNNASHRQVWFQANRDATFTNPGGGGASPTICQLPAIEGWKASDPTVAIRKLDLAGDGRVYIAWRSENTGPGMFHYEFAVYNLNSHRSVRGFAIPFPEGKNVSNAYFHDVDYHSGEPFDNTDWPVAVGTDRVGWAGDSYATNQNANALRWGTMYNFAFDADFTPEEIPNYELTLFRPAVDPNDAPEVIVGELPIGAGPPANILYPAGGETLNVDEPIDIELFASPTTRVNVQVSTNYAVFDAVAEDDFENTSTRSNWNSGGPRLWDYTNTEAYEGSMSAASGNIADGQLTWLEREHAGGGTLQFWYKVSSEANFDELRFKVGSRTLLRASGETDWTLFTYEFETTDPVTLRWEYRKDGANSAGQDKAWIDNFVIGADTTSWSDVVETTAPGTTLIPWTPTVVSEHTRLRVRNDLGDGEYGEWDLIDHSFAVRIYGDATGDCAVNLADLAATLAGFGTCDGDPLFDSQADFNHDLCLDLSDVSGVLSNFGATCP
ncbi:MAG: hypothetical protein KDA32_06035 [Phycisphaerales bacterium]|nr:hypothetical protein [Phycisphaerales bacterium]